MMCAHILAEAFSFASTKLLSPKGSVPDWGLSIFNRSIVKLEVETNPDKIGASKLLLISYASARRQVQYYSFSPSCCSVGFCPIPNLSPFWVTVQLLSLFLSFFVPLFLSCFQSPSLIDIDAIQQPTTFSTQTQTLLNHLFGQKRARP